MISFRWVQLGFMIHRICEGICTVSFRQVRLVSMISRICELLCMGLILLVSIGQCL